MKAQVIQMHWNDKKKMTELCVIKEFIYPITCPEDLREALRFNLVTNQ